MSTRYRSREELRQIIRSVIASSEPPPLSTFDFDPGEEQFFRARAAKAVDRLARKCSKFKSYYSMPTQKPFLRVAAVAGFAIISCIVAGIWVWTNTRDNPAYPVFAALLTVAAAAAGWWA